MAALMQAVVDGCAAPAGYPGDRIESRRLADGTDILIRPIRPADDDIEFAFVCGLSRDTGYNRLLSARKLTTQEIRRLTRIDYDREMALVAVTGSGDQMRLLGVARYVRDADAGGAEFAIVIADAWQKKGIGTLLLRALLRHAHSAGIGNLHGITFATNQAMQMLGRKLGFVQTLDPADATVRHLAATASVGYSVAGVSAGAGNAADGAANDEGIAFGAIPRATRGEPGFASCPAPAAGGD